MRNQRDAYRDAIDKVRFAHRDTIPSAQVTVDCPRCRTKQVILDKPGYRRCLKCGFEFRPRELTG